ncbi:DNA adenine methylase [Legionella pneumophila serogroup 1]
MLNRYIGNKNCIIDLLINEINNNCNKGDFICDAFSGSLAVSFALKKEGYKIACNDINLFSYFYGKHLIEQHQLPNVNPYDFMPYNQVQLFTEKALHWINSLSPSRNNYLFLKDKENVASYQNILSIYFYLNEMVNSNKINKNPENFIFNTYTEEGNNSYFESSRGTSGRRKFFTPLNGKKIDYILAQIREWKKNDKFSDSFFYYTLVCSLMDSIEKVSNTQGTYHDFPRESYDSRAYLELKLIPPDYDGILTTIKDHIVGCKEDSLEFIEKIPEHSLLYLDPPYNFRQYTSYYFLPNIICEYSDIDDLDEYFSKVQFVRGQNMDGDFTSTFSKKNMFMDSLSKLISKSKAKKVMLSYFDGRNHWNNTKNLKDRQGKDILWEFFNSSIFFPGKSNYFPIERLNYQSYGGHKARNINELVFLGEKFEVLE